MQRGRYRPRLEAHASDVFTAAPGRRHRQAAAIAGNRIAGGIQLEGFHFQRSERRIDEARGAANDAFLAQHIPWLERLPQFEPHAGALDRAQKRKAELALRYEPGRFEAIAGASQVIEHAEEVLPDEVSQHE